MESGYYDTVDQDYTVILDNLPGKPEFDEYGQIKPKSLVGVLIGILVPVAILTGHCVYAYVHFLK